MAKDVFEIMVETYRRPAPLWKNAAWKQATDNGAIEAAIDQLLARKPRQGTEQCAGKDKLMGYFVGQAMKAAGARSQPACWANCSRKN